MSFGGIVDVSGMNTESIRVLVRVRPINDSDNNDGTNESSETIVDLQSHTTLALTNADGKRAFQCAFDAVLGPQSTQSDVYQTVRDCTISVLNGVNATIFAYGQTGSGKTYSMYGPPSETGSRTSIQHLDGTQAGVIPRAIHEIFELGNNPEVLSFSVFCSFVQIYNENLFDMLRDASMASPLNVREDKKEIYVQGLSEYNVHTVDDTLSLLAVAENNRAIRETYMNMFSSRSHSIFQLFVGNKSPHKPYILTTSFLSLYNCTNTAPSLLSPFPSHFHSPLLSPFHSPVHRTNKNGC